MKVCVLGDGGWGTALAMVLNNNGHHVNVWGPDEKNIGIIKKNNENINYLPGVKLPISIEWNSNMNEVINDVELIVIAVPSKYYRNTVIKLSTILDYKVYILSATKGIDEQTHETMSEISQSILNQSVAVISGPSHAEEVARGIPSAVTIAANKEYLAEEVQNILINDYFRIYTSSDVKGVELGGALKNIIAIAAGISDGLGYGDNTKAALITRGLAEIIRLGVSLGADIKTFSGLSGLGDLMVTCMSKHSRNRGVGERIGQGESLENIMNDMKMVAEGVWNCKAVKSIADKSNIKIPIIEQTYSILYDNVSPKIAMESLMKRLPISEVE